MANKKPVNAARLPSGVSELVSLVFGIGRVCQSFWIPEFYLDSGFRKTLSTSSVKMKTTSHFACVRSDWALETIHYF